MSNGGFPEISGYEVIAPLGEGGMGTVYLARDLILDRQVAIKVISGKIANDAEARQRFLREARTLATVEHSNVVRIYAFGEVDENAYLVLEYVQGETLAEKIVREGSLPLEDALRILGETVDALEAAHECGVVHRDIKPSNILINRRGQVRVADFGLAKPLKLDGETDSSLTRTGYMLGTPHYVSPEQAVGKPVNFRTDVYSLGIVMYEMLTGERPFQGTTPMAVVAKALQEPLPDVRTIRPEVPDHLLELLSWMTRKEPEERPASYQEIREALGGHRSPPATQPAVRIARRPSTKLMLLLFALIVTAGIWFASNRDRETVAVPQRTAPRDLVIAVAPFWGPDDVSEREGRVMAALVERSIESTLGEEVRVAGIDQTNDPIRSHEAARELGRRFDAGIVVWGEALSLRGETEILPSFTLVGLEKEVDDTPAATIDDFDDLAGVLSDRDAEPFRLSSDGPDQIELRRMSANGVGDVVPFLAGLHSLHVRRNPGIALSFFDRSSETADLLRQRAQALIELEQVDEAITALERAVTLDPDHAATRVRLGDLLWVEGREEDAIDQYLAVSDPDLPVEASQALIHEGKLFVRELWRNESGELHDSGFLLVTDPYTRKVLERHYLPGNLKSMRSEGGDLVIEWNDAKTGLEKMRRLVWRDGDFTEPIYGGGNLLRRMTSMRAGRALGRNFLNGIHGSLEDQAANPRYAPPSDAEQLDPSVPGSYEEMESVLAEAIERDPTQPWYLFHLGFVQKETGRADEAEATWSKLSSGDWPGVPYWVFSWMTRTFERLGEEGWADAAFRKTTEIRARNPQPAEWSTMIDRLLSAPLVRWPESDLRDPERAYTWLLRGRELTGPTEGTRLAAAIWSAWFEAENDFERALQERGIAENAFDPSLEIASLDYLFYALASLALLSAFLTIRFLLNGWRRSRHARVSRSHSSISRRRALVIGCFMALVTATLFAMEAYRTLSLFLALLLVGYLVTARTRISLRDLAAAVTSREKTILLLAVCLLLPISAWVTERAARMAAFHAMPVASLDSLGHPVWIEYLDEMRREVDSPLVAYAAAVSHHLAGDFDRAVQLYEESGDPRSSSAIAAARAGTIEVEVPSGPEFMEMAAVVSRQGLWKAVSSLNPEAWYGAPQELKSVAFVSWQIVLAMLLVILSMLLVPSRASAAEEEPRWKSKIIGFFFPAYWWLRGRRTNLGSLNLLFVLFLIIVGLSVSRGSLGAPGLFQSIVLPPNFLEYFPVPLPGELTRADIPELYADALRSVYPGASIFWSLVWLSLAAVIVLHVWTIFEIVRSRPAPEMSEAETEMTPIPTHTSAGG